MVISTLGYGTKGSSRPTRLTETGTLSRSAIALYRTVSATKQTFCGWLIVCLLILGAIFAGSISPYNPLEADLSIVMQEPSWSHPLGTDELGRDLASRLLHGARLSLALGILAVTIAFAAGVPLGAMAGYFGGWLDQLIMRFMDILLSFPTLLLAIIVIATLGPGFTNAIIAVGFSKIPVLARVTRGAVLAIKQEPYVEAARALGASHALILFKQIMPNAAGPLIVQSALLTASAILAGSGLGFLGLGAQPPMPEWGAMLSKGRTYLRVAPRLVSAPGIAIAISVIGFNLAADSLQRMQASKTVSLL